MTEKRKNTNAVRVPTRTPPLRFTSPRDKGEDRCYAVDCEMVTIAGPGSLPRRRAMVAIGVVNERLETLLHGRVAVPRGCEVVDGTFARMEG